MSLKQEIQAGLTARGIPPETADRIATQSASRWSGSLQTPEAIARHIDQIATTPGAAHPPHRIRPAVDESVEDAPPTLPDFGAGNRGPHMAARSGGQQGADEAARRFGHNHPYGKDQ